MSEPYSSTIFWRVCCTWLSAAVGSCGTVGHTLWAGVVAGAGAAGATVGAGEAWAAGVDSTGVWAAGAGAACTAASGAGVASGAAGASAGAGAGAGGAAGGAAGVSAAKTAVPAVQANADKIDKVFFILPFLVPAFPMAIKRQSLQRPVRLRHARAKRRPGSATRTSGNTKPGTKPGFVKNGRPIGTRTPNIGARNRCVANYTIGLLLVAEGN